jgi:hypothetical protein
MVGDASNRSSQRCKSEDRSWNDDHRELEPESTDKKSDLLGPLEQCAASAPSLLGLIYLIEEPFVVEFF